MTIKIYHNPRCSKSRQAVEYLASNNHKFEVVEYLKNVPTIDELKDLVGKLKITPKELLRSNEAAYKENDLGADTMLDDELYFYMEKYPNLIQRPIIVKGNKACIARPLENLEELLK